jgi:CubicO group peptidase (beta-lactamase class C family)
MPLPLDFPPGTRFSYSNTGYIVLATIAAGVSHENFGALLHETILDPAGLHHTGVLGYDAPTALVPGYKLDGLTWAQRMSGFDLAEMHAQPIAMLPMTPQHGDGELYGTADDLYRWTTLTQGSALVSDDDAATIFAANDGYGFGWMIGQAFGTLRYRHTGEFPGYLGNVSVFPQKRVTLIVLDDFETPMNALVRDSAAIALGQAYDMPFSGPEVTLAAVAIAPLVGRYALADGQTVTVRLDPRFLLASIEGQFEAGLLPFSATEFYMPLSSGKVTFSDIRDGVAHAVDLRYNGVDHRGTRIP